MCVLRLAGGIPKGTATTGDFPLWRLKANCLTLSGRIFNRDQTPYIMKQRPPGDQVQNRISKTLRQHAARLASTKRQLQKKIRERQRVEATLKTSGERYARLLKESLQLQQGLRKLTHQILRLQEADRKQLSHELQDEIAQALLGINVRLLALKQKAHVNTKDLKQEITSTQRLVARSARAVRQVARKLGNS